VTCFNAENRPDRTPTWSEQQPQGRWRMFSYEELMQRDKCNLDIFWLKDESLEDSTNLPEPDIIIVDIIEDLRTALEQLEEIAGDVSVAG
jgi:type I restriction enzyme M protein